jgi:hypothetical protein
MSARSPIQALPVWTIDTVEDYSLLPAGSVVTQYDQSIPGGWSVQCIGGLLYSFYAVDNGELDDPTSQSFLYYRSFSAGAWATPIVLFTSVVPGEMLAPFGASIGGAPVILVGIIDPTTYPAYASLTHFILFGSPGSTLTISGTPPSGQVGVAYGFCFTVTGGTPPYTFSTPGPLPPGLSLSPSTGCITGTPLASPSSVGTWCFVVTVTDSTLSTATTSPCITIFATILIQLIGWKLYPESPCGPLSEVAPPKCW